MAHPSQDDIGVYKQSVLKVDVPLPEIEEEKIVYITSNGTTEVEPSDNKEAMEKVIVNTNVQQIYTPGLINPVLTREGTYNLANYLVPPANCISQASTVEVRLGVESVDLLAIKANNNVYQFSGFVTTNASFSYRLPTASGIMYIQNYEDYYKIYFATNNSGSAAYVNIEVSTYDSKVYYQPISGAVTAYFLDMSQDNVFSISEVTSDTKFTIAQLYKTRFNLFNLF